MDELTPAQVIEHLKRLSRHERRTHWSVMARLLRRVETERIYATPVVDEGPYESAEAWADTEDIPRSEWFLFRRLGRLMERDLLQPWEQLTRAQAVQISRIAGLDDVAVWVRKAQSMPYAQFRREVERVMKPGQERFVRYAFYGPESFAAAWSDFLVDGLRILQETPDPDPALIDDPQLRFRCVEGAVQVARDATLVIQALTRALDESLQALRGSGQDDLADRLAFEVVESTRTVPRRRTEKGTGHAEQTSRDADGDA